jgi:hypothetical protein
VFGKLSLVFYLQIWILFNSQLNFFVWHGEGTFDWMLMGAYLLIWRGKQASVIGIDALIPLSVGFLL